MPPRRLASGKVAQVEPVELVTLPKKKRSKSEPACAPLVHPKIEVEDAAGLARIARALGDPVRLQIVDVLHHHAGAVCVCEINDLFDLAQSTVSHHLKVLRDAGIVDYEKRGLWGFYYVKRDALDGLGTWLLEQPSKAVSPSADVA
jgi:ArsR family transcriptional regulator